MYILLVFRVVTPCGPVVRPTSEDVFWDVAPCSLVEVFHQALMMEAVSTYETSVNFYQTTRRNIPEDSHLHTRHQENLKSGLPILQRSILPPSSGLMIEIECSSETPTPTYKSTRRYNPEDQHRRYTQLAGCFFDAYQRLTSALGKIQDVCSLDN
jgi:hypothetical protein